MQNCKLKLEGDAEYADVRVETAEDGCVVFAGARRPVGRGLDRPVVARVHRPGLQGGGGRPASTPDQGCRRRRLAKAREEGADFVEGRTGSAAVANTVEEDDDGFAGT